MHVYVYIYIYTHTHTYIYIYTQRATMCTFRFFTTLPNFSLTKECKANHFSLRLRQMQEAKRPLFGMEAYKIFAASKAHNSAAKSLPVSQEKIKFKAACSARMCVDASMLHALCEYAHVSRSNSYWRGSPLTPSKY